MSFCGMIMSGLQLDDIPEDELVMDVTFGCDLSSESPMSPPPFQQPESRSSKKGDAATGRNHASTPDTQATADSDVSFGETASSTPNRSPDSSLVSFHSLQSELLPKFSAAPRVENIAGSSQTPFGESDSNINNVEEARAKDEDAGSVGSIGSKNSRDKSFLNLVKTLETLGLGTKYSKKVEAQMQALKDRERDSDSPTLEMQEARSPWARGMFEKYGMPCGHTDEGPMPHAHVVDDSSIAVSELTFLSTTRNDSFPEMRPATPVNHETVSARSSLRLAEERLTTQMARFGIPTTLSNDSCGATAEGKRREGGKAFSTLEATLKRKSDAKINKGQVQEPSRVSEAERLIRELVADTNRILGAFQSFEETPYDENSYFDALDEKPFDETSRSGDSKNLAEEKESSNTQLEIEHAAPTEVPKGIVESRIVAKESLGLIDRLASLLVGGKKPVDRNTRRKSHKGSKQQSSTSQDRKGSLPPLSESVEPTHSSSWRSSVVAGHGAIAEKGDDEIGAQYSSRQAFHLVESGINSKVTLLKPGAVREATALTVTAPKKGWSCCRTKVIILLFVLSVIIIGIATGIFFYEDRKAESAASSEAANVFDFGGITPAPSPSDFFSSPEPPASASSSTLTGQCTDSVGLDETCYQTGAEIFAIVQNCDPVDEDWVAIYYAKIDPQKLGDPIVWAWTCGDQSCTDVLSDNIVKFDNVLEPGYYRAHMIHRNPGGPYSAYASSETFKVVGTGGC